MTQKPPRIFDRRLVRARRARARGRETGALHRDVAREIVERLSEIRRDFRRALVIGSREIAFALDALGMEAIYGDCVPGAQAVLDDEALPFARGAFDLAVSALSLHATNDLPGALVQIRHCLAPGGLFLGALYGGETLKELREALAQAELELRGGISPRVAPFADVRDLGQLLQRAGFLMPVADVNRHRLTFANALELMRALREMGETNALVARGRTPLTRRMVSRTAELYREKYGETATFEIVYLAGWAPRPQEKPVSTLVKN